jgi:hypothetical protein
LTRCEHTYKASVATAQQHQPGVRLKIEKRMIAGEPESDNVVDVVWTTKIHTNVDTRLKMMLKSTLEVRETVDS